ncbi:hypothetical protein [Morganella phage Mecenats66]|nr:hypothetical protein [Morganella phage Mecenats66]
MPITHNFKTDFLAAARYAHGIMVSGWWKCHMKHTSADGWQVIITGFSPTNN